MNTARQPSTALGCWLSTCTFDALDVEDKNDVNDGVEDGTLECWELVGPTGKEGIVVERTTYGQYGRCSLSKSIWRALGSGAKPVLLSAE